jgi:hypothetical protein
MTQNTEQIFHGNGLRMAIYPALYVVLFALIASVGLLGENWPFLFGLLLLILLPSVFLVARLSDRKNRFSFDDERRVLARPGRRDIPYERIRAIYFNERGRALNVFARQGALRTSPLVEAMAAGRKQELVEELNKRFPKGMVRRLRWSPPMTGGTLLLVFALCLGGAHGYLYHRYPQLALFPRTLSMSPKEAGAKTAPKQRLGEYSFTLPRRFLLAGDEGNRLFFGESEKKERIEIVVNTVGRALQENALAFRWGMNVRNVGDLLDLAYQSKVGLVPLLIKAADLAGITNVALIRLELPLLRGYVIQGWRGWEDVSHIVLVGKQGGSELHFFITGPSRVSEKFIRTIVTSVRRADRQG